MDHSPSPELQAHSNGNPHGKERRRGRIRPQMGADRGRWWQMGDFSQKSAPRKSRRRPRGSLTETWTARAVATPKTSPQTVAHFAKTARKQPRKRPESPKTIPKNVRKTVQTLNKGPNFRMVDTYATPFLFDWPSCASAWHYPGGHPSLVRKPLDCSRNHPRRPPARARLGSGAPQT